MTGRTDSRSFADAQDDREEVRRRGSGGAKIGERDEVSVVSILKQQQKFLFFIKI